jgi:serine/threonine protein kinase
MRLAVHSFPRCCWAATDRARRLRPQVLTAAWEPKLIDCGLSKLIDPDAVAASAASSSGGAFGTPGYQCPVYQQTRAYDWSSEMFSLGVVLLELLTGSLATGAGCANMGAHFAETDDPEDPARTPGCHPLKATQQRAAAGGLPPTRPVGRSTAAPLVLNPPLLRVLHPCRC